MSAWIAFHGKGQFIIATDTLAYKQISNEITGVKLASKIQYIPWLKCSVVSTGYNRLSTDFYSFVQNNVITDDILGLIKVTEESFLRFLDLSKYELIDSLDHDRIGNLEFFGFSDKKKEPVRYTLLVFRDRIEIHDRGFQEGALEMHPDISPEIKAEITKLPELDEIMIELMKAQYDESQSSQTFKVALGGVMTLTVLQFEPEFVLLIRTPHNFNSDQI